jgi:hypothetical protein
LRKLRSHFPGWRLEYDLPAILSSLVAARVSAAAVET